MTEYNQQYTIGWDVGGAHLKAALFNADGQLRNVLQVPCALWQGLHLLERAIAHVQQDLLATIQTPVTLTHGVTMTGELVDLFNNRETGVSEISRVMATQLTGAVYFYKATEQACATFITYADVSRDWASLASVNWHASTMFVAQGLAHGLFIDMGSTTTDLITFADGRPNNQGVTDAARMQHQALIYTGMVRTPLMAVAQTVRLPVGLHGDRADQTTQVAAEYFATMADVYRLTGDLKPSDDMSDTADGQDKSVQSSARRIARMVGYDVEQAALEYWVALANAFKEKQMAQLGHAVTQHLQRLSGELNASTIAIVGAGIGAPLIQSMIETLPIEKGRTVVYHPLEAIAPMANMLKDNQQLAQQAGDYLPAVAVAYFMQQQMNTKPTVQ